MSGSVLNKNWSLVDRENQAERLARLLGWKGRGGNETEILEFLEDVPAFEIDTAAKSLLTEEEQHGYGLIIPFGPVIEPYETENCVVSKDPLEMAREAWTNEIDLIVTGASFEGIFKAFYGEDKVVEFLANPSYFAPLKELNLTPEDPKAVEYGKKIKNLYYEDGQEPSLENQKQYLKYVSDFFFWHGLYRTINSRLTHATGKTYLMRFDIDGELNMFKKLVKKLEKYEGTSHADDLFYIFNTEFHEPPPPDSKEFATIKKIVGIFTSFAITGDLNCEEVPNLLIEPITNPSKCINFTVDDVAIIELPEEKNLKVWDSIYNELNVPLY